MPLTLVVRGVSYPLVEVSPERMGELLSSPRTNIFGYPLYHCAAELWPRPLSTLEYELRDESR